MAASRPGMRLRRRARRTGFESPYRTRPENKMGPARGPISVFWRCGESRADDAPSTPGPLFQFYQNQFPRGIGNILGQMLATRNEQGIARIG